MSARLAFLLSGAVGLVLTALLYFAGVALHGILGFLVLLPQYNFTLFIILLFVAFVETIVMALGLQRLVWRLPNQLLNLLAAGYVGFAGVYALLYALFVNDPLGVQLLAGLGIIRWLALFTLRVG